jgi:hypothetical protein
MNKNIVTYRMLLKGIMSLLAIVGIAFLLMVIASQATENVVRARIDVKKNEPFTDAVRQPVTGMPEMNSISGGPADLENQRQPYHLMRGVIPDAEKDTLGNLSAQTCYEGDFQTRFQPVHNYLQRTNNYKRAAPDSCSSPMTQFVTSFYKTTPLARQM